MKLHALLAVSSIAIVGVLLNSCGGSSSGNSSSGGSVTLSGTLGSRLQALSRDFELQTGTASSVSCTTAENPPTVVLGSVSNSGSFSVDISSVSGEGLSCSVLDAANEVLGTILYENPDEKSMGGDSKKVETVPFSESKDLGSLDLEAGQFLVNAKTLNISTTGASISAQDGFDPTGTWVIETGGVTLPAGYVGPCADPNNCHGPSAGQKL